MVSRSIRSLSLGAFHLGKGTDLSDYNGCVGLVEKNTKYDYLMQVAHLTAKRSKCMRRKVGCVIADPSLEVFVVGYNGGPRKGINHCRRNKPKRCGCIHAEMNALVKAPRGDKIAFVTCQPCEMCATLMVNASVTRVYYGEEYIDDLGLQVLDEVGIPYQKLG